MVKIHDLYQVIIPDHTICETVQLSQSDANAIVTRLF